MKSLLLTGATGTLGRALTKRLLDQDLCERICLFSRGEHTQAEMRQDLHDDQRLRWLIGDVRDRDRLRRAMRGCDTVVHAAALKRIETGHRNPVELARTNVDGTINVVEGAQDAGVEKVLLISSDKAWSPASAYGFSKAMAEAIVLAANNTVNRLTGPMYSVVRYGNVFASAGSVVPKWISMIHRGATAVPVSSLECTRFFMEIDEAVDLVLDTIATMKGGELAIPTLPAYRLADLVEALGVKADIKGLPSFEKLHEGMSDGNTSDKARRMSVSELRERLAEVGFRPKLRAVA